VRLSRKWNTSLLSCLERHWDIIIFPYIPAFRSAPPSHISSFSCQQTCYYFMFASLVLHLILLHSSTCLVLVHIVWFINLIPSIHLPQVSLYLTGLFFQQIWMLKNLNHFRWGERTGGFVYSAVIWQQLLVWAFISSRMWNCIASQAM